MSISAIEGVQYPPGSRSVTRSLSTTLDLVRPGSAGAFELGARPEETSGQPGEDEPGSQDEDQEGELPGSIHGDPKARA